MSAEQPNSTPPPGAAPLWGSSDGSGSPVATESRPSPPRPSGIQLVAGGGELDPFSRRLFGVAVFLSILLLLVLANSFLNGGGEERLELNPVAAAAERTQDEPGARFSMKMTYGSPQLPRPMAASGHGAYSGETGRTAMTMNMELPRVGPMEMEMVSDGTSMYMRMDEALGQLPEEKEWLVVEPFGGASEEELMMGGGDAESSLQLLGAAGEVRRVGREKVRGVATQRYWATVDLPSLGAVLREEGKDELADQFDEYSAGALTAPVVEVSIDDEEIVRRFRMVMEIPTQDGVSPLTMDMRMEFFDFGAEPRIELPESSTVFDATALQEQFG